jgi:hypothetical protein
MRFGSETARTLFFEPETAYWPLSPSRGRRNHPANLTEGQKFLADLDDKNLTFVGDVPVTHQVSLPNRDQLQSVKSLVHLGGSSQQKRKSQFGYYDNYSNGFV